jgi:hypothetical protein
MFLKACPGSFASLMQSRAQLKCEHCLVRILRSSTWDSVRVTWVELVESVSRDDRVQVLVLHPQSYRQNKTAPVRRDGGISEARCSPLSGPCVGRNARDDQAEIAADIEHLTFQLPSTSAPETAGADCGRARCTRRTVRPGL